MSGEIVVLTGASGCLGFHTLRHLISKDACVTEVRCLDLREPETSMKSSIEDELAAYRKKHSNKPKEIVWIQGDIRDLNLVEKTLEDADCVIHCAAKVDIWTDASEQNVDELESIHVKGTETLLKASIRLGISKFIHVSSFEVYTSYNTIYYATENTLPETKSHLFGASASTKQAAEDLIKRYANNKLDRGAKNGKISLNAIIIRFPAIYGEYDRHYLSKILQVTKTLGGKLQRVDNIWIRQQPIYVGNAAWSLVRAKQRMDIDDSISGEEFHITDETAIGDSFDFVEPYLECRGMHVTKQSYPFVPIWLLLSLFAATRKLIRALDVFGLFTRKKSRLQEAIEKDKKSSGQTAIESKSGDADLSGSKSWYQMITPQTLAFMCVSCFLNRTKASLRLDYEPLYDPIEAKNNSLDWYKNNLIL